MHASPPSGPTSSVVLVVHVHTAVGDDLRFFLLRCLFFIALCVFRILFDTWIIVYTFGLSLTHTNQTTLERIGKKRYLWIVDLAGSERGRRTQVEACSTRQREGSSINTSLSTLFQCFKAML